MKIIPKFLRGRTPVRPAPAVVEDQPLQVAVDRNYFDGRTPRTCALCLKNGAVDRVVKISQILKRRDESSRRPVCRTCVPQAA